MSGSGSPLGMTALKERRLIRRLRAREEAAFEEMVRLYQHQVYNLVYRMIGNQAEAEDVAQEVFVTVFKAIDSFREEAKFSTWLYRIAANHCKNRLKYLGRRAHKRTGELDEGAEQEIGGHGAPSAMAPEVVRPDAMYEGLQLERIVQEGIAQLDEEHREVLVLRDVEDLTYEDISQITGLPDGTVKSRLHRARIQLKEFMARRMK